MRSLNRVFLIGRAGTEPEVATSRSGHRVATFRLATDRPGARGRGRPDWHTIVAWDALVPLVERQVRKGERVYVEGRIETREERVRGGKRNRTEIIAEEVIPLGTRT
jgi:single-strand DNA-binding protein